MTFKLNSDVQKAIFNYTSVHPKDMKSMSAEEIDKRIEKKIGKRLKFSEKMDPRLIGRGSVFIYLKRFINEKKINKKFAHI